MNNDPNAGGTAAFGVDPQARIDFGYNSYDLVTQAGKAIVAAYYDVKPIRSYFQGCSEGGREALLMSQRFPHHYDGIIAGDPVLHLPKGPMNGVWTTQIFAGSPRAAGSSANGEPAISKTYTDQDLLLVRTRSSVCATSWTAWSMVSSTTCPPANRPWPLGPRRTDVLGAENGELSSGTRSHR